MAEKRNAMAFPRVGDIITTSTYGIELKLIAMHLDAEHEPDQMVYVTSLGTMHSTSLIKWSRAVMDATQVSLAEDMEPVVLKEQEPECKCASLLWGHMPGCNYRSKQ